MKKIILGLLVVGAVIGAFLPESETGANPKVAQVKLKKFLLKQKSKNNATNGI